MEIYRFRAVGHHQETTRRLAQRYRQQGRAAHEKLNGKEGTTIIFNTNLWHAATTDHTGLQRRTVHIYYCHPWIKPTGHTKLPSRLLESVDKPFLQEFYQTNWGAVE